MIEGRDYASAKLGWQMKRAGLVQPTDGPRIWVTEDGFVIFEKVAPSFSEKLIWLPTLTDLIQLLETKEFLIAKFGPTFSIENQGYVQYQREKPADFLANRLLKKLKNAD